MFVLILVLLLATPASAQPYERPFDDSDPEMQALAKKFFEITPCNETDGLCPEALGLLSGGADRMARYMIRQYEENLREGYPNTDTYLRMIGYTESETAFRYLSHLVDQREAALAETGGSDAMWDLVSAVQCLGMTRRAEAEARAVALFESSDDPYVQEAAEGAYRRVAERRGQRPDLDARVERAHAERERQKRETHRPDGLVYQP